MIVWLPSNESAMLEEDMEVYHESRTSDPVGPPG